MEEELKETIQILHKQIDLYKDRINEAIKYNENILEEQYYIGNEELVLKTIIAILKGSDK